MREHVAVVPFGPDDAASDVLARVTAGPQPFVLIHRAGLDVPDAIVAALAAGLSAPMAATASPIPSQIDADAIVTIAPDPRLPPPPTVSAPCGDVCLVARAALASVPTPTPDTDWPATWGAIATRLVSAGWRHVAAPRAAFRWEPPADPVNGRANEGLATHRLWVATRVRPLRVVVDGACLTDDPHNGSQAVVWNVALGLRRVRPDASVTLAVAAERVAQLRALARGSGVDVVTRDPGTTGFDVVYRPYQPLDPGELTWLARAGARFVTSQLDMIAFSNPRYHPAPALFHAVRNLQRHTMRLADAVTFISEFGRQTALAECPDLDPERTSVVGCGADADPLPGRRPDLPTPLDDGFVVCTSATFWHKNRQHAIRVFAELCREHDYRGSLVIAGPEPYYGGSGAEEADLLTALEPDISRRVVRAGLVDASAKWWLLERADAVLYPSVVEGFGLVPFEAAAVGTPCLAPAASALAEVLGGTAALVPDWDAGVWAAAAARVISSSDAAQALVAEVRARAEVRSWDATAERTWEAIDAALARPRARRHVEEGSLASRVAGDDDPLVVGARLVHFANRVGSYARRRLRR